MLILSTDCCHQISDSSDGGEAERWRGSQWGGELMIGFVGRVVYTYIFGYPLVRTFAFARKLHASCSYHSIDGLIPSSPEAPFSAGNMQNRWRQLLRSFISRYPLGIPSISKSGLTMNVLRTTPSRYSTLSYHSSPKEGIWRCGAVH